MSLHIRRALRKAGRVLPYVTMGVGAIFWIGGHFYYESDGTEGPVHDRRRELVFELGTPRKPSYLLNDPEKMKKLAEMKKEYDGIMARPDVQADMERDKRKGTNGLITSLAGLGALVGSVLLLARRKHSIK